MGRILIVEDVLELAEEIARAAPAGHEVVTAVTTHEALRMLEHDRVDLVVTALVLERDFQDGLQVVQAALKVSPTCQTIIVTSYGTPDTCLKAIQARVFDYIERNSPGIDFIELLRWKMCLALSFGDDRRSTTRLTEGPT